MKLKTVLFDETAVKRALMRISHEIIERNKGSENLVFIGIKTRGVPMAECIGANIEMLEGKNKPVGSLDITLFRDDLSILQSMPEVTGSKIDFDVNGKDVILCDDVIHTGRTVRAAIEAIMKLGRPKTIQLAVLIDRGHRELPIRADYVGKNVPTALEELIEVSFSKTDGITAVSLYSKE